MQRRTLALWALLPLLASCSGKTTSGPEVEPPPPADQVVKNLRIEGNVVTWETDDPYRPFVRYGDDEGDYDHVAYPAAGNREDRAFQTQHQVPLLGVVSGTPVHVQLILEREVGGDPVVSDDQSLTPTANPSGVLTSTMIHIGWGDAHLMTMPNGKTMLMDAGDRGAAVVEFLEDHGVTSLDVALASHVHADHIGGMVGSSGDPDDGVLERIPTEVFLDSPTKLHFRTLYPETLDILADKGIERVIVVRGDTDATVPALALDPNVAIEVLNSSHPPDETPRSGGSGEGTNINNESIVLRFTYGDVDWVIGGDAEVEAERSMLAYAGARLVSTEYYKAHHHGRFDGSSSPFLRALEPRVSLIPVSSQEYSGGLPDYEDSTNGTIDRIAAVASHYYVIDDVPTADLARPVGGGFNYNITFATDGSSYEIRTEIATQTTKSAGVHSCEDDHPVVQDGVQP